MEIEKKSAKVMIVGAGISGLVAAINLERLGYSPTLIDATDRVGGRVKTDTVEGYQLDHGFQVLLDTYPAAKKYLNYEDLNLQKLLPGALIYKDQKSTAFGDPIRNTQFLFSTAFSGLGTLADKWKIFRLNQELATKDLKEIFEGEEVSTLEYLKRYGFSDKIIANFFRPFFSGIFLEPDLATSSRMFEFVYKMFGKGSACIPKDGMEEIPKQLATQLKQTTFLLNTSVKEVRNKEVELSNGELIPCDFTIVATDPGKLIPQFTSALKWKSCTCLYFTCDKDTIKKPLIGLNANYSGLVNNIFYSTSISNAQSGRDPLLSVTVVKKHKLSKEELIAEVSNELKNDFAITTRECLKTYEIPRALPDIKDLQYNRGESESLLTEHIAIAGDSQLNGSLNAAMLAGEAAAEIAHRATSQSLLTFA